MAHHKQKVRIFNNEQHETYFIRIVTPSLPPQDPSSDLRKLYVLNLYIFFNLSLLKLNYPSLADYFVYIIQFVT